MNDSAEINALKSISKSVKDLVQLNLTQRRLFDRIEHTHQNFFVQGQAGTGKSTFIKYLKKHSKKRIRLVAPTAIAALNIEGATIHSMFTLPLSDFLIMKEVLSSKRRKLKSILKKTDVLVIDEVSMLRPDVLDAVEALCCQARGNLELFGGLQIILIGDLCQLPPIIKHDVMPIFRQEYGTDEPYFFDAKSYQKGGFEKVELSEVYRQSDQELLRYLQNLRHYEALGETVSYFNQAETYPADFIETAITITPYRQVADNINKCRLAALSSVERSYDAQVVGSFEKMQDTPSPKTLVLKEGALVIFNKNNYPDYINGTSGVVEKLDERAIVVRCLQDRRYITVHREEWKSFTYDIDSETGEVKEKETGSFVQFPLQLGYALTIHKAQGKTLDRVIVDIDRGAFAHGQLYVALSRTRRKADMLLRKGITEDDIIFSARIKSFLGGLS
ncbi:AAA family ATPase [bacterium]|nr:AAA family ATPase [bacterium]MBR2273866.1 AAA family ATPase [Alphaproteobacteria bacterium]